MVYVIRQSDSMYEYLVRVVAEISSEILEGLFNVKLTNSKNK